MTTPFPRRDPRPLSEYEIEQQIFAEASRRAGQDHGLIRRLLGLLRK